MALNNSVETLTFLFLIAALAGFLDTLAGGGGLITIPALIASGVSPLSALATNKLQACIGSGTASFLMIRLKRVEWNNIKWLMLTAFSGSALGTISIQFVDTAILSFVIPSVLLLIAVYFIAAPLPAEIEKTARMGLPKYCALVVPAIGFYDGMFGPGTGSFFNLAGISLRGQTFLHSTAVAKTLNFATNIASVLVFLFSGRVAWNIGFTMMAGQAIGATLGSHYLFKVNPKYVRILIVVMCLGMLVKYAHSLGWHVPEPSSDQHH